MALSLMRCVEIVNQEFDLDIREKVRLRDYVIARQVYFYIARKYTIHGKYSLEKIGKELASHENPKGWDHSSVLHNLKTMQNDIETGMYQDSGYLDKFKNCKTRAALHANIDEALISEEYINISRVMDEFEADFKLLVDRTDARIKALKQNMKKELLGEISESIAKDIRDQI